MATIPMGQKFHTVSSSMDTTDRGSATTQTHRSVYTMQDIAGSIPQFTTDLDTEIQVGTVDQGGVVSKLYYQRFELNPISGGGTLQGTTPALPGLVKTNYLFSVEEKGLTFHTNGFISDQSARVQFSADDSKGNGFWLTFAPTGGTFSRDYTVNLEAWYTK